jgi:hypothetical protein
MYISMKKLYKLRIRRQLILAVFSSFFLVSLAGARDIVVAEGGSTKLEISLNTYEALHFENQLAFIRMIKVDTEIGIFSELVVPGYSSTYLAGSPKLPVNRKLMEIPFGAVPELRITGYEVEEYDLAALGIDFPLIPAQPPAPKDGSLPDFEYNAAAYARDAYTNDPLVEIEVLGIMRGLRIARIDICPVQYNPVSNKIRVYRNIEAEVFFRDADIISTLAEKQKSETPYFKIAGASLLNYKPLQAASRDTITKYPVKFVIVSDRMFEAQLQPFIEWKTKKGFHVVEAYTDETAVGNTTASIKNYLQGLYNAGTPEDPAPSFVLFVGDVAQIPAFSGNAGWHVTDLMYVEYTGDYFPEVYYGRWSATSPAELQPQIDKTLQYEQYTMPDPSFFDEVVMVAGMDSGHGNDWGNGQINYGTENYFNAAHSLISHTYLYPESGSHAADIIQNVSDGVSFGNYTAHCSASGWASPSFTISDVAGLQNQDKYGVLIGNCCSSNEFNNYCFGEALLRAENKGAVAYIGGTNSTYWDEDYYFGVGVGAITEDPPSYEETTLGTYDRAFHDHGEPWEDWYTTTYQMIFAGNLAVTEGKPGSAQYYWEIYCVMGDPSLMCYFGVPDPMIVTYDPLMPLGAVSFTVYAEPYAYVGISKDGVLHGAALADATGTAVVTLDPIMIPGNADVVVSRQNRQPFIGTVFVDNPAGPYVVLSEYVIDDDAGNNNGLADYGESILLDVELVNLGGTDAADVEATLSSSDQHITITDDFAHWGNIAAGAFSMQADAFAFDVHAVVPDQHLVSFGLDITGEGKDSWYSSFSILLHAPVLGTLTVTVDDSQGGNGDGRLDPGETAEIIIPVINSGHSDAHNAIALLSSSSNDIVFNSDSTFISLIEYDTSEDAVFSITVSDDVNPGTSIPFEFIVDADGYEAELEFFLVAGQIPVLVLDLDPNHSSGTVMNTCLDNLSVGSDYATSIPESLNLYSSVFVCLGIYSSNHILSASEGQMLADYLDGGGNLYMEGGDTWFYDQQTAVHPMFGISGLEDGSDDLGTLLGQDGTFTEGIIFTYSGENNWIDRIVPNGSAFAIFNNQLPQYGTAVAHIGSSYRTIGSSHEFGGLDDGDYTKDYLMFKYLEFFGIDAVWVGMEEAFATANLMEIFPNPAGNTASIRIYASNTENIRLSVYNSTGQEVARLADGLVSAAGPLVFRLETAALPAGVYHCVLSTTTQKINKKLVVIK